MTFRVKLSVMSTFLYPARKSPLLTDIALLLARIGLGVILIAHGWQKFNEWTLAGTAAAFADMGVPLPAVTSGIAAIAELVGGILILVGLIAPLAALLNVIGLLVAFVIVHVQAGVFVENGGFELVIALAAGLLLITVRGAGKFSIDALLSRSRGQQAGAEQTREPALTSTH